MIPRLRTWAEGVTMEPSMWSKKGWVEWVREFGPMIRVSDCS